ncbi:asparagine synthase-related protein [Pontixanthobacter sp.]|uniref:asparagine synthase-related protein n=1 Tax=Pontixanthobacter sp. TaxID=2792078 RepID=UPI003C7CCFA8
MSGIGAIYHQDGAPASKDSLNRMSAALSVYGSARQTARCYGAAGLCWGQAGHFAPEDSFDQQPVVAGDYRLVFAGFLYHRSELAEKLAIPAQQEKSMADSALVMAAWLKWGMASMPHLYGEYAIIVWDERQQSLVAVRSETAAIPIYFHRKGNRVALACAPKGLFALGDISRELNEEKIADALTLNNADVKNSFYRHVHTLPLGHMLIASRTQFQLERFYHPDAVKEVRFARSRDYVEAAQELFTRSISSAMRSVRTPVTSLSAGLDSSAVTVEALSYLGRAEGAADPLISFTAVPARGWDGRALGHRRMGDESGPVRALAEKYPQLDARFVDSADLSIEHELDRLIFLAEAPPFAITNLHWLINIHALASSAGRSVLLNGQSGNRTLSFSGKALYAKLFSQGRWVKLWHELKRSDNRDSRYLHGLFSRAIKPNLSCVLRARQVRGDHYMGRRGWANFSAIHPDYAEDMKVDDRAERLGWDSSYSGHCDPRAMMLAMKGGTYDLAQTSQHAVRVMSGVTTRDPLGDRKISEFCLGLPDDQFLSDGQDRRLIRRMMADKLPHQVRNANRGRQAADWHMRMTRDLPAYRAEIARMADDPDMARRFDVPRLTRLINSWPECTPLSAKDHPDAAIAAFGMSRAIATSRFINWVSGKN